MQWSGRATDCKIIQNDDDLMTVNPWIVKEQKDKRKKHCKELKFGSESRVDQSIRMNEKEK